MKNKIKDSPTKISLKNKNYLPRHFPSLVFTVPLLHSHFEILGKKGSTLHTPAPHFTSAGHDNASEINDLDTS